MPDHGNPITPEARAELRAKLAAAKIPQLFAQRPANDKIDGCTTYEVDTGGEKYWFALCLTSERAELTVRALNALPALLDALDAAEAERDAQSLAKVKAEALREAAKEIGEGRPPTNPPSQYWGGVEHGYKSFAEQLIARAGRLEASAMEQQL